MITEGTIVYGSTVLYTTENGVKTVKELWIDAFLKEEMQQLIPNVELTPEITFKFVNLLSAHVRDHKTFAQITIPLVDENFTVPLSNLVKRIVGDQ